MLSERRNKASFRRARAEKRLKTLSQADGSIIKTTAERKSPRKRKLDAICPYYAKSTPSGPTAPRRRAFSLPKRQYRNFSQTIGKRPARSAESPGLESGIGSKEPIRRRKPREAPEKRPRNDAGRSARSPTTRAPKRRRTTRRQKVKSPSRSEERPAVYIRALNRNIAKKSRKNFWTFCENV